MSAEATITWVLDKIGDTNSNRNDVASSMNILKCDSIFTLLFFLVNFECEV